MKRNLLAIALLCAAFALSACQSAQKAAPAENPELETPEVGETAELETPEVGETAELADFTPLVGTWVADEGLGVLTVYENGGFLLGADDTLEGYLSYTDTDGEAWESGPRYELYLENNERVGNCFFALDDAHPGKLAYAVGGGAQLFSRPDAVYGDDGIILRLLRVDDAFADAFPETVRFVRDDGEYSTEIAFCATSVLPDFKFLAISWVDSDENGSFFSVEELYALDELTPEVPLVVSTSFPGDMPTNGVSFTDADGATRDFAILESGYDGTLVISPFTRSETP